MGVTSFKILVMQNLKVAGICFFFLWGGIEKAVATSGLVLHKA